MGDHGARFRQDLENACFHGLAVDLAAGGSDDHLDKGRDLFALEDFRRRSQVLEAAVGAGTQEDLVHIEACDLADGMDVVDLGGTCGHGDEVLCPVGHDTVVDSIGISVQALHEGILTEDIQVNIAVFGSLFIRGEEAALGAAFDRHIGHGHAAGHAHGIKGVACEFQ